jgi:competence protein ComEC
MRVCALAFLLGILLVQQLADLPSLWWGALLLPLAWLSLRRPSWLLLMFFVAGVFWVTLRASWVLNDALPNEFEGVDLRVTGYIADIPRTTEHGVRFALDVSDAEREQRRVQVPDRIVLSSYGALSPNVGEQWQLSVRLKRPHGFQNPGGFDYERDLFQKRIRATGYVRAEPPPQMLADYSARYAVDRLRQRLGERIRGLLGDEPHAGIIVALVNGDRSGITDKQWIVFRRTGTNHLMAISGLHIGLVAGFVFFLVRWLWALPGVTVLRWPAPKVAAVAAIVAAIAYAALAGFAIPTQRALIMVAVAMGAVLTQRRVVATQLLAAALLAVLVYDPLATLSAGFWLSFAAVSVIVLFLYGRRRALDWRNLGYVQWGIAVGLLPLLLIFFQQVSLVGPLANFIAVPVFGLLVVPFTLAGAVTSGFLPDVLSGFLLQLALWPLELVWTMLAYLAGFTFSVWVQHSPGVWALACAIIGVVLLLAPAGWPARWLGAVWLMPMLLLAPSRPGSGEIWFTLLDVGQGLSAVVRTSDHTLIYDTGPRFSARFDTGRAVVIPYLRHQGVRRVDTLVISHGDNDHIGGASSVLAGISVGRILSSVPARLPGARWCSVGQHWRWDDVDFAMLHPSAGHRFTGNNASCVMKVSSRYGAVLLPGDIEAPAERELVAHERETLAAQILVVPHQGSKTSSTSAFIDAVRPQIALFATGYRNRFGHPNPEVKARYQERQITSYASSVHGAIEIHLGVHGIETRSYRQHNQRYWFNRARCRRLSDSSGVC